MIFCSCLRVDSICQDMSDLATSQNTHGPYIFVFLSGNLLQLHASLVIKHLVLYDYNVLCVECTVCVCVCACVRACVRACGRACVRSCVRE